MKKLFLTLAGLLLYIPHSLYAQAGCTTTVNLPTPTNVQNAVKAATDGDVICLGSTATMGGTGNVPAGMSDWTGPVEPTEDSMGNPGAKAVEIRGAGSFTSTCLQIDNSTPAPNISGGCGSAQQTKLYIDNGSAGFWWHTTTSTKNITVSNIYFYADGNSSIPTWGSILAGSQNAGLFILHHNDFVSNAGRMNWDIYVANNRGLIYRNRFINQFTAGQTNWTQMAIQHPGLDETVWASASTFGTADTSGNSNVYIETNYIINYGGLNDLHDGGAREVLRFNEIHNSGTASHGFDTTGAGGGRGIEIYRNTFYCDSDSPNSFVAYVTQRTGTGFVYDNTFNAYSTHCTQSPNSIHAVEVNQPAAEECDRGAIGWSGQGRGLDATHNSYPIPHQIGWGWDSNSSTNPLIGPSPSSGTAIHQTNEPGALSATNLWPYPSDGVQQSLQPYYTMHNTNSVTLNSHLIGIKNDPTDCRAQAWSTQSKANSQTLVIPENVPSDLISPIPYANVGEQAIMVFADLIGSGTITPTITAGGSNSCGTITALNTGTSGSMRLSAWTCTVTADGPQTITFTSSAAASTAARAGTVIFLRGLLASPTDANPAVKTNTSTSTYSTNTTGMLAQAQEIAIGYFAFPVPSTDNLQPGSSDSLPQICNSDCANHTGMRQGVGRYVGTNGTTGGSDVSVATTYRVVNATTALTDIQETDSTQTSTGLGGAVTFKINCALGAGCSGNPATTKWPIETNSSDFIAYNTEVYDDIPSTGGTFNGTSGTGAGTAASIPNGSGGACTNGTGYWATDVANGNGSSINQLGALYVCGQNATSGHWPSTLNAANAAYIPYIFPHPLDNVQGGNTQSFSVQPSNTLSGNVITPHVAIVLSSTSVDTITVTIASGTCSFTGTNSGSSSGGSPNTITFTLTGSATGTGCTIKSHDSTDLTVGDITSSAFDIGNVPTISVQPQSQTIVSGQTAGLSVTASGVPAPSYQWYQGSSCTGSTVGTNSNVFTTPPLFVTTTYSVKATNEFGNVCSSDAVITVSGAPVTNASGQGRARFRPWPWR